MRALIYNTAILPLTSQWYAEVLRRVPDGSHVLDVGIGTGGALCRNAELVRRRSLTVTGIDIDPAYVRAAEKRVHKVGLSQAVDVSHQSVYDHLGGPYEAVYFSASFMLLPDPKRALEHVMSLLTPTGRVYFTQTFEDRRSPWVERAKPLLKQLTTIDFGTVTYEADFRKVAEAAGLELLELSRMGQAGGRSYRLAVGQPYGQLSA